MSKGFEGMDELIRDLEKFSAGVVEQAAVPAAAEKLLLKYRVF